MDDFKNPWSDARKKGYDRLSGEGYYRNAYDFVSARDLLLGPARRDGSGKVVLCAHDPLTGEDHRNKVVAAPIDAVLIVDSVFAFRPEYNSYWDYRIWLDVDPRLSLSRRRGSSVCDPAPSEPLSRCRGHLRGGGRSPDHR
jgi:uridine kinase